MADWWARRLRGVVLIVVGWAVVAAVVYEGRAYLKSAYPAYSYRYRLVVEVAAGDAVRQGASVIEVEVRTQPRILNNNTIVVLVHGDGVFVDLGGERHVIALLAAGSKAQDVDYPDGLVPSLFRISYGPEDLPKLAALRGRRDAPEKQFPTFVTFADMNDAGSAHVVRPDEFARVFGPGVQIKSIWLEMTDGPVTRQIESRMPQIIQKLRDDAKVFHIFRNADPYVAQLGHFTAK